LFVWEEFVVMVHVVGLVELKLYDLPE